MRISAEKVYALVADFNQWKEWSPWYPMDTTTQYVFSGTPEKAGYSMEWKSENEDVGKGKMVLKTAEYAKKLSYNLSFEGWDMVSLSEFEFKPTANGVQVIWTDKGQLGWNPMARWFGLFMDKWMGKDFEKGLEKMEKVAHSRTLKE